MEKPLKVLINFNEEITRKQLKKHFYYSWKKMLPSILKNFLFLSIFFFIIDNIFDGYRNRLDFLKFVGFFLILYSILYGITFYFNKVNYNSKINEHINELKKFDTTIELLLDNQSLHIKCEQYDLRSVWEKVTYNIYKETLLIFVNLGAEFTFLLNEEETEQYSDVLDIIKQKSKLKK